MKKIIILIAILCSFGFSKCAITKSAIDVNFSCKPSKYEAKDVKQIGFVVHIFVDKISSIYKETIYKDDHKIVNFYRENYDIDAHDKIIPTVPEHAIIRYTEYKDKYGITIETDREVIDEDLLFLYSEFKKEYNL